MTILRKYKDKLQMGVLVVMVFAAGFLFGTARTSIAQDKFALGDTEKAFEPLYEVYDLIQSRYVDNADVNVPDLVDGAINGMVTSLGDQFSSYMNAESYQMFSNDLAGEIEGIGATVRTNPDTNEIEVVNVLKGSPALAAGVLPGDIFWEIDGIAAAGMTQDDIVNRVRGPAGTEVRITFKRGEDFVTFNITRAKITIPNVESRVLEESNIAYVRMNQFTELSRQQVSDALKEVDVNSRAGLIFDLRGNPGGLLTSAVDVSSLFIKEGVLLYEVYADDSEDVFTANGTSVTTQECDMNQQCSSAQGYPVDGTYGNITVPIVVLVDEGSASASELFSGAIKDYGVATLIGEKTFGKGTVQTIQPLSNSGALRITIARYLTPKRLWIHEVGVQPDMVVEWNPKTPEELNGPDPQLEAAVEFLTKK